MKREMNSSGVTPRIRLADPDELDVLVAIDDDASELYAAHGVGLQLASTDAFARAEHLPFNRPYYERHGFVVVSERECGPGVLHHLEEQRRALPAPHERVAMRRRLQSPRS
jgi:hypothetical protein